VDAIERSLVRLASYLSERFGSGLKVNTGTADISKFGGEAYRIASLVWLRSRNSGDANRDVGFRAVQGPARHREIEGFAAAVLSGLFIGSAATDRHIQGNFFLIALESVT
jgi:hypothetical protein